MLFLEFICNTFHRDDSNLVILDCPPPPVCPTAGTPTQVPQRPLESGPEDMASRGCGLGTPGRERVLVSVRAVAGRGVRVLQGLRCPRLSVTLTTAWRAAASSLALSVQMDAFSLR